jgi:hypothetical protein
MTIDSTVEFLNDDDKVVDTREIEATDELTVEDQAVAIATCNEYTSFRIDGED